MRSVTVCVSVLAVLGLAILPPEHLHARHSDDDHQRDVVHRHFEAHPSSGAGARAGHDEAVPQWLASAYLNAGPVTRLDRIDAWTPDDLSIATPEEARPTTVPLVTFAVHDPLPGAAVGMRAPPFPSV